MRERHESKAMIKLLKHVGGGCAKLKINGQAVLLQGAGGRTHETTLEIYGRALAEGLISNIGGAVSLLPAARSFLRRAIAEAEEVFLAQHADIVDAKISVDGKSQQVRLDLSESPLGSIARLKDRDGIAFLPAEALSAGERLAGDFTRGQLQPRVTASWEPRLSDSGKGARGGMADLADSAMASRLAVNRAVSAMGPELSGVALDVCCFMKGLTVVERERQWPARSAKLMLRAALMTLARHYAPPTRMAASAKIQHWGEEGYRPDLG